MFGLQILDVVIGLVFIYLLLALICATILEMAVGLLDCRTANLYIGIQNLLGEHPDHRWTRKLKDSVIWIKQLAKMKTGVNDQTVADDFFNPPLVKSLREENTNPSYIPAATFASVVIDMYSPADGNGMKDIPKFSQGVKDKLSKNSGLRKVLLLHADQSKTLEELKKRLEEWFDDGMARVSARYKYKTQMPLLFIALAVCIAVNADTFRLAGDLYRNPAQNEALIDQIKKTLPKIEQTLAQRNEEESKNLSQDLRTEVAQLNQSGLTLGWKNWQDFRGNFFKGLAGTLLTALAATLGAPFWFDILKRFMSIRAVGKSLEEQATASAKTRT